MPTLYRTGGSECCGYHQGSTGGDETGEMHLDGQVYEYSEGFQKPKILAMLEMLKTQKNACGNYTYSAGETATLYTRVLIYQGHLRTDK